MKQIVKQTEPPELRRWKEDNANIPENLRYSALHGTEKAAIRQQMLEEQGYLCAYTMLRIETSDDCHIEHIVPQAQQPISYERDIEYQNMLACFPGNRPDPKNFYAKNPYGARHKNGAHIDAANFVSPLDENVEGRFQYAIDGTVSSDASDIAASRSIEILRLDHPILNELRRAAIDERIFAEPLSAEIAEENAVTVMLPDPAGRLPEFCLAVSQAFRWYANVVRSA